MLSREHIRALLHTQIEQQKMANLTAYADTVAAATLALKMQEQLSVEWLHLRIHTQTSLWVMARNFAFSSSAVSTAELIPVIKNSLLPMAQEILPPFEAGKAADSFSVSFIQDLARSALEGAATKRKVEECFFRAILVDYAPRRHEAFDVVSLILEAFKLSDVPERNLYAATAAIRTLHGNLVALFLLSTVAEKHFIPAERAEARTRAKALMFRYLKLELGRALRAIGGGGELELLPEALALIEDFTWLLVIKEGQKQAHELPQLEQQFSEMFPTLVEEVREAANSQQGNSLLQILDE